MADNNHKDQISGMTMEDKVKLFQKLTDKCFAECSHKNYEDAELAYEEIKCTSHCVSKYFEVKNLVSKQLGFEKPPV